MTDNQDLISKYSDESIDVIHGIYEKYKDNPYMLSKTRHLICNQLSNMLDNILKTHDANELRFEELSIEKDAFVESFLNNNRYFFNASTEAFFIYDGLHYQNIKEDDLLHAILSTISQGRYLLSWKQKTRMNIMKRIKENNILKSIPESETIQFVIDLLYPTFFASKNEAKYFLCILGDALLKKNTHLVHFIKPFSKNFIQLLNELSNMYIGVNVYNTFKHKYHEHEYKNCRMVLVNDSIKTDMLWKTILPKYILDILSTASHYSIRYNNSDDFLVQYSNETELCSKVFYLRDRNHLDMITQFKTSYLILPRARARSGSFELLNSVPTNEIVESTEPIIMTWKNMIFLWKHYLDSLNLPAIMFQQTLKHNMIDCLTDYYSVDDDLFKGIFSKYLPFIQKFIHFFDVSIVEDEMETDFEIEELLGIFKQWSIQTGDPCYQITERQIIDIINYYYPNILIDQDKFLHHIRCLIWDKQMDIQLAITDMRNIIHTQNLVSNTMFSNTMFSNSAANANNVTNTNNTSIYDMYIHYCKYYSGFNCIIISQDNTIRPGLIVSKSYFYKYILDHYSEYIVDSTMLNNLWTANL